MIETNKYSDRTARLIKQLGYAFCKEHNFPLSDSVLCMTVFNTDDEVFVIYRVQPES